MQPRRAPLRSTFRSLASQFVPAMIGFAAASCALTFATLTPGGMILIATVGLLVWWAAALVLRAVRKRPILKWIYRLALLGHVVFWSIQGWQASTLRPAGVPQVPPGIYDTKELGAIRAGVAVVPFELSENVTLAGWGMRPRRIRVPAFGGLGVIGRFSQDVMAGGANEGDPRWPMFEAPHVSTGNSERRRLSARTVIIQCGQGVPLVLVRLDLVTVTAEMVAAISATCNDIKPAIDASRLIVAASHTHSGPGGLASERASALVGTDHYRPDVFASIVKAAAESIHTAWASRATAKLAPFEANDRTSTGASIVARNRRAKNDTDIDDRVFGLRIDAANGSTMAVVVNYAVHPTVMRKYYMNFGRDLVGAIDDALEAELGGGSKALFFNGAQGDIGPQRIEGLKGGERARELGKRFSEHLAAAIRTAPSYARGRLQSARAFCDLGSPYLLAATGNRREWSRSLAPGYARGDTDMAIRDVLALPVNALAWSFGLSECRIAFGWNGTGATRIALDPSIKRVSHDSGAFTLDLENDEGMTTRLACLWQPGEATQALGKQWRAMASTMGFDTTWILGLANGATAYFTTPKEYAAGGYEALATLFGPEGGELIGVCLEQALQQCEPEAE